MKYFDSHTHLQFAAYDIDREEVLRRALDADVGMINVGTRKETSKEAVDLANQYANNPIYATVGLHPIHTAPSDYHDAMELQQKTSEEKFDYDFYKKLALMPKVVGIGECGLDYFRINETKNQEIIKTKPAPEGRGSLNVVEQQKTVFKEHIELAKEVGKPLMIHCRPSPKSEDAYEDLYEILKPEADNVAGVVIHFFVGSPKTAKEFLDLGFYFTFGGVITFTRDYDETIKLIPLEKILLETDAPYVTPAPHRGKRNEPAYVVGVYKKMAELKDMPLEELTSQILENNKKIFNI